MDVPTGRENQLDSTQIAREVDEACDRFEAAWRAGDRPRDRRLPRRDDRLGPSRAAPTPPGPRARLPRRPRGVCRAVGVSTSVPRARRPDRLDLRRVRPTVQAPFAAGTWRPSYRRGPGRPEVGVGQESAAGLPPEASRASRSCPSWAAAGWASSTRPARSGSTAFAL